MMEHNVEFEPVEGLNEVVGVLRLSGGVANKPTAVMACLMGGDLRLVLFRHSAQQMLDAILADPDLGADAPQAVVWRELVESPTLAVVRFLSESTYRVEFVDMKGESDPNDEE
jgi:hypothetical protein